MTANDVAVAADVGGTRLRVALVSRRGVIEDLSIVATPLGDVAIIEALVNEIAAVTTAAESAGVKIVGVGIGLPGKLSKEGERWSMALNLGVGEPVDVRSRLEARIDHPVSISNDVRLATIGAAREFPGFERIAYLSIGTGVAGGGLTQTVDGVVDGHSHYSGEVGHVTVPGLDTECLCGQRGCVESGAGGAAMVRRWVCAGGDPALVTHAGELWACADRGSELASSIRDDCVMTLAWLIRLYVVAFGADAVVLGGGVSRLGDRLADPIREQLRCVAATSPLIDSYDLASRIRMAPPTAELGLIGAARTVFDSGTSP